MGILQASLSSIITIVAYGLLLAGVYKAFQIHSVLGEIRDFLRDIKHNTQTDLFASAAKTAPAAAQSLPSLYDSPDAVIRALSAEPDPHASQHS